MITSEEVGWEEDAIKSAMLVIGGAMAAELVPHVREEEEEEAARIRLSGVGLGAA